MSSSPASPAGARPAPRLPTSQLAILMLCRFAEPVALTGVFPYLPEMIESFGVARNDVARWAGITSAVFSVSQCLTAIAWGRASDRYGRKPAILLAMSCACASILLFGFSRSLTWAIVARACSGASNGNVGILRTAVAEMVPQKELQPRAFSALPLVWQVGSILGPILGGALASPATKFPGIFGNSAFFKAYPFALPNLVAGVLFTFGIAIGWLFLKESLADKKNGRDYGRVLGNKLLALFRRRKSELRPADDFESALPSKGPKSQDLPPIRYIDIFTPQSTLNLVAYTLLALHVVTYDQLLPVFLHFPKHEGDVVLPFKFTGGFGLDSGRIGVIFTLYAIFSMICQFTLFPIVTQRYGSLTCLKVCTAVFPITYIVGPYAVLMPTDASKQAAVLAVLLVKGLAGVFAFPCVTILMTNSAKSLRVLGTLNGVAVSVSAIGRGVGPYMTGRMFTWGADAGYIIAAWWLLAIFAVPGHLVCYWLVELDGFGGAEDTEEMCETAEIVGSHAPHGYELADLSDLSDEGDEEAKMVENGVDDDDDSMVEDEPLLKNDEKI
jgi:MFS family permease